MPSINLVPVFIAAIVAFIIWFIFNSPLFAKIRTMCTGIVPDNIPPTHLGLRMLLNVVANFVMAYFLALMFSFASFSPYFMYLWDHSGVYCGFIVWLGFLVSSSSIDVIWNGKKPKAWLFECACSLVVLLVMGAIIWNW